MSVFFDISSTLSNVKVNGTSIFSEATLGDRAPGGFQSVDVCIFNSNNCNGGKIKNGLQSGQSAFFTVELTGDFSSGETTITGLHSKIQTQDGSYTVAGVPEPMTIAGTLGAIAVGTVLKRRSSKLGANQEQKDDVV